MFVRSIIVLFIILFFGSCSHKADSMLVKRKYNKGYFFAGKNSPVQSKKHLNQTMSLPTAGVNILDDIHFINNQYDKNENQQTISDKEDVKTINKDGFNDKKKVNNNGSLQKKENIVAANENKKFVESKNDAFIIEGLDFTTLPDSGISFSVLGVFSFLYSVFLTTPFVVGLFLVFGFLFEIVAAIIFLKILFGRGWSWGYRFLSFFFLVGALMVLFMAISILILGV